MYLSPYCNLGKHGVCRRTYGHNVCSCDCHHGVTSPAVRAPLTVATQPPPRPMFEVVGEGEYDGDSDTLTYSQRALLPHPPAPRMFWVMSNVDPTAGSEHEASGVPGAFAELFNRLVSEGREGFTITVEEQPF